jgi:hypothetical protein
LLVAVTVYCVWSVPLPSGTHKELTYLDLKPQANQKLTEDFHKRNGSTLKDLPQGEQTLGSVKFKIGTSAIQLAGAFVPDLPEKAEGIKVDKAFRRLHILHGTGWGGLDEVADGTLIGEYKVHYEDKSALTISVVYGEDVRDWWNLDNSKEVTRGKVAWTGENDAANQSNLKLRLYLTTWVNPKRDKRVVSIDYLSRATKAAPFCIAMTLEEK